MSKQTDLWMPVYIGDYLRDTQRLTTEQHGAYFLLLMDYWCNGPLPENDEILCSITNLKMSQFRKHKPTLLGFFTLTNGKLHHKRVEGEKAKADQHANRRSEKASKAAHARWHGSDEDSGGDAPSIAPSMPQALLVECPKPSPSVTNVTAPLALDDTALIFSEGLALLKSAGWSESRSRSYLGKSRQKVGDARMAEIVRQAQSQPTLSDPGAWIQAAVNKSPANDQAAGLSAAIQQQAARMAAQLQQ